MVPASTVASRASTSMSSSPKIKQTRTECSTRFLASRVPAASVCTRSATASALCSSLTSLGVSISDRAHPQPAVQLSAQGEAADAAIVAALVLRGRTRLGCRAVAADLAATAAPD
eukprot:20677-Heterococcus_DN1.PRE.1